MTLLFSKNCQHISRIIHKVKAENANLKIFLRFKFLVLSLFVICAWNFEFIHYILTTQYTILNTHDYVRYAMYGGRGRCIK